VQLFDRLIGLLADHLEIGAARPNLGRMRALVLCRRISLSTDVISRRFR